jgi:hypothetical protein
VESAVSAQRAEAPDGTDAGTVKQFALAGLLNVFCSFPAFVESETTRSRFR